MDPYKVNSQAFTPVLWSARAQRALHVAHICGRRVDTFDARGERVVVAAPATSRLTPSRVPAPPHCRSIAPLPASTAPTGPPTAAHRYGTTTTPPPWACVVSARPRARPRAPASGAARPALGVWRRAASPRAPRCSPAAGPILLEDYQLVEKLANVSAGSSAPGQSASRRRPCFVTGRPRATRATLPPTHSHHPSHPPHPPFLPAV
jgi:hypothetical protein